MWTWTLLLVSKSLCCTCNFDLLEVWHSIVSIHGIFCTAYFVQHKWWRMTTHDDTWRHMTTHDDTWRHMGWISEETSPQQYTRRGRILEWTTGMTFDLQNSVQSPLKWWGHSSKWNPCPDSVTVCYTVLAFLPIEHKVSVDTHWLCGASLSKPTHSLQLCKCSSSYVDCAIYCICLPTKPIHSCRAACIPPWFVICDAFAHNYAMCSS